MFDSLKFADKFVTVNGNFVFFWKGFLSQWFKSPFRDKDGQIYTCCEQYMMAEKAVAFGDTNTWKKIMATNSPREQKDLGREVQGYDEMKWRKVREDVVYRGNVLKFIQHKNLKEKLLATDKKILVEASPFDKIWGVGMAEDDPRIISPSEWLGLNLLGIALMRVRYYLQTGKDGLRVSIGLHD